ncbi:MAG: hypothetical protein EAZ99_03875 [Alphaproteobacteria bacterium]|nr:hypothetical protein [Alphaproteobacteria bacterium]TAD91239.1 MAG: hypothetical protein EAZ99_03875 [Alphaproteobacteria bacterium]
MDTDTYLRESARTASTLFRTDVVSVATLKQTLEDAITLGQRVDQVKKGLFYGKPVKDPTLTGGAVGEPSGTVPPDLLHAALGIYTEAVELMQALLAGLDGAPLDRANLLEELGDIEWFMALAYRTLEARPEAVRQVNIDKLRKRFPDRFTEAQAIDKDIAAERDLLDRAISG